MRRIFLTVVTLLLALLVAGSVSAKPVGCTIMLPAAERDAAVDVINDLMGAAMRTDGYMVDLAMLQEAQRVMAALDGAQSFRCEVTR